MIQRLISRYLNLPLPIKIALFGVVSVILFIIMASIIVRSSIAATVSSYGQEQVQTEATILEAVFSNAEEQVANAANFLTFAPGLIDAVTAEDATAARAAVLLQGDALQIDLIRVYDAQRQPISALQGGGVDFDSTALDRLLRLGLVAGSATGLLDDTISEQPFLVAVGSLKDTRGLVVGVVLVGQVIDADFLNELNFGREGVHLGLITDGELIAVTAGGTDKISAAAPPELIARALGGEVLVAPLATDPGARPDIEAYLPVLVGGETVGVWAMRVEYEPLFALQDNLLNGIRAGVVIAAFLISNVLVVLIQTGITRPFIRLTRQIERIAKGEYSERVPVKSSDEIGRLGTAFNQMTDAVQAREADLKALNQTLEKRVEERTHELREARDEAVAAQQVAQENSRLKSEFLSTMSHELRTPLNAIEGFSSIMLGGMGVELSPIATDMMKRISANSKRLLHLINDFLDLSRIEAGRLDLVKEPIDLRRLVRRWQDSVSILAEEKKLAFIVDIADDVPQMFTSDEDALTKIVVNLLSNAFKFTQKGSVSLTLRNEGERLTFAVRDTGIGIPVHARAYIFEEFRQVDGSSKREFGGTGLGLALVSKLSRLLDGSVALDSEVGVGSTFTVEFPLVVAEQGQVA